MLSKEDHIAYWKREADRNWETADYLRKGGQYVMALFMLHLVVEKLLKAHWVKDNLDSHPPRTHDLQYLHNQSDLDIESDLYDYLAIVNQWSIDTRYPDYKEKIYSIATAAYVDEQFKKVKKLRTCLLEGL
jgi:HEPN domain-containing protein